MNLYEHTIIARQDVSVNDLKKIEEKYLKIVEKFKGKVVKSESWGLLNLSYLIKKNKKGNYIHFKIEGDSDLILELEKNERIDKNLLRFVTIRVKKFDLKTEYFNKDKKTEYYNKDKKTEYFNKDKNKQEKSN